MCVGRYGSSWCPKGSMISRDFSLLLLLITLSFNDLESLSNFAVQLQGIGLTKGNKKTSLLVVGIIRIFLSNLLLAFYFSIVTILFRKKIENNNNTYLELHLNKNVQIIHKNNEITGLTLTTDDFSLVFTPKVVP